MRSSGLVVGSEPAHDGPMTIPYRTLGTGSSALTVSAVGLGCMGMSFAYGAADEGESEATLLAALESGVTFFDTADMYGFGANEELVGRVLRPHRDQVVIATKYGNRRHDDGHMSVDGSPAWVRQACEDSLRRLGVDVIDLYYQHRVDPSVPVEETWAAMAELVSEGKVRHLGISEAAPETIRRAHAVFPITAVQTEWSLWTRDVETDDVLSTVRELGIGFVPYSPLGRGFLSGTIRSLDDLPADDWRRINPRFQGRNLEHNLAIADGIAELADSKGVTASQVALAWVLAQGEDVVPIPGTKRRRWLHQNVAAVDVELTAEDLAALDAIAPAGAAAGPRYPEAAMGSLRA